uniref:Uncharacterized protein n=1 Tax=Vitis vinifera TaxID=29760 RepID=A5AKK5_VITVI|nr:hypothetical protein VITISV_015754 [Vitis vinifera]
MEFRPSAKIGCPISGRLGDFCLPNGEIGLENCIFGVSSWPEWQGWLIMSYGSVKIIGMGGVGKIIIAHFGRKVVGVVMHCGCGIECIEHSKTSHWEPAHRSRVAFISSINGKPSSWKNNTRLSHQLAYYTPKFPRLCSKNLRHGHYCILGIQVKCRDALNVKD